MPTIRIKSNYWMEKNLNVTTFRNGDAIPEAKTAEEWTVALANRQPAWRWTSQHPEMQAKHGMLYNWYAITDPRNIAPVGFTLPSIEDLESLIEDFRPTDRLEIPFAGYWSHDGKTGDLLEFGSSAMVWSNPNTQEFPMVLLFKSGISRKTLANTDHGYSVRCIREKVAEQKMDGQTWMKENYDAVSFQNGEMISEAKDWNDWVKACEQGIPVWCWNASDFRGDGRNGKLYNVHAVLDRRGLAPEGWRLPSEEELPTLIDYITVERQKTDQKPAFFHRDPTTGRRMKVKGRAPFWTTDLAGTQDGSTQTTAATEEPAMPDPGEITEPTVPPNQHGEITEAIGPPKPITLHPAGSIGLAVRCIKM